MAVARRIIPCLLHDGHGNCVKPISFKRPARQVGSLMAQVEVYAKRGPDELAILDCQASLEGRKDDFKWLKPYVEKLSIPLLVGGSIVDVEGAKAAIDNGADAVVLRSVATLDDRHKRIYEIAHLIGSSSTVYNLCITETSPNPKYETLIPYLHCLQDLGVGEIIITDMERDGTMLGPNLELIKYVSDNVKVPVVAAGGIGTPWDIHASFNAGADAAMVGSMFLYTDNTPRKCANYLKSKAWNVRIDK
jgi:imidazole glycerol-phosphate synthase subunit HisF